MTVIVAGMLVLDLIPALPADPAGLTFRPGTIIRTGPAMVRPGGIVANTGAALHRLGVPVRLLAKIGDDAFGHILQDLLAGVGDARLVVSPEEMTAHSFVLSPPGIDRMIINHPGANATFTTADISDAALQDASIFHFGYPTAMRSMFEDGGRNLIELMSRARAAGLFTSLDMSYPDPASPGGQANWRQILGDTLPLVDFFMPSLAEAVLVMKPPRGAGEPKDPDEEHASAEHISRLGQQFVNMGAAIVVIKVGERGIYLRTGDRSRLARMGGKLSLDLNVWADRELWANIFDAKVVGTNGAGDATAAGLLLGLVKGMSPEHTITAACAVGASSVEAADAVSAVPHWHALAYRMAEGWRRREVSPGPGWRKSDQLGIWVGQADHVTSRKLVE